jgi:hypothetical protein
MVGVQSTGVDPVTSVKLTLRLLELVCWRLLHEPPLKIKHSKETYEIFDQNRLFKTVWRRDFQGVEYLQLKRYS